MKILKTKITGIKPENHAAISALSAAFPDVDFSLNGDVLIADNEKFDFTAINIDEILAADKMAKIKAKAGRIIYATFSQEKQNNANNRATELALKMGRGKKLTRAENAELAAIEAGSAWINAVRAKSNELETKTKTHKLKNLLKDLEKFATDKAAELLG